MTLYLFIYFLLYNIIVVFATHWHESTMGVHVLPILNPLPSSSPSHLSGSSQCTSPEHPVSYIELGLAIRFTYDNLHVSMLFSQIILPLPSPTESAALFVIARTRKQPRYPSADEWIRKLWYIYTMEYYSASKKTTFELAIMRWMKLELIIQSEVSQKEKHQYSILTHVYGI